ncbi:PEP/pyruvate-binding domain-containing protein [Blastococcus sp. SYSU D00813]
MTGRPLPLAEVEDEQAYGGKAAALGVATRAGLPVPPGVALPADLVAALDDPAADWDRAREQVRAAARGLGGALAARSSAVGEDGTASSYAGQHLTVLNLSDPEDLVDAVLRVARSCRAESALAYRRARGDAAPPACGVVLQRLVPAVAAGVVFTADPVHGDRVFLVEASWALGQAVVDGLVVPDLFRLDHAGRLVEQVVGSKDLAVVPAEGGGTVTVEVERRRARQPCLTPDDLRAVVDLARRCDEVFGGPSDVEFATDGGRPALLQRRPITTLV